MLDISKYIWGEELKYRVTKQKLGLRAISGSYRRRPLIYFSMWQSSFEDTIDYYMCPKPIKNISKGVTTICGINYLSEQNHYAKF